MNTYRLRLGEPGTDLTKAGFAVQAMKLADVWFHVDDHAYVDTVKMYLIAATVGSGRRRRSSSCR
jgi:hypothetical protein